MTSHPTWLLSLARWLPVLAIGVFASACASSDVSIMSAIVSQDDTRIQLDLAACNIEFVVDVTETQDEVIVSVSDAAAPLIVLGRLDCDDSYILELDSAFAGRKLVDGTSGSPVSVSRPLPAALLPWPYDRDKFTEAEYLKALEAMVACIEATDPEMDAWVFQDLDWITYRWHKEPDERGNTVVGPALETCRREHLEPLQ